MLIVVPVIAAQLVPPFTLYFIAVVTLESVPAAVPVAVNAAAGVGSFVRSSGPFVPMYQVPVKSQPGKFSVSANCSAVNCVPRLLLGPSRK